MAVCVDFVAVAGEMVARISPTQPDPATCQYVILSGADFQLAVHPLLQPMTVAQGVQISVAVAALWAVAAVLRSLRAVFQSSQE